MKAWVKAMIKDCELGYLSISDRSDIRILPFPYSYDKGHLIGSLSIVHKQVLNIIEKVPQQQMLLVDNQREISISGMIRLKTRNLDEDWKQWNTTNSLIHNQKDREVVQSIPHLQKRVVIDFVPYKIEARTGEEVYSYEMEIL